MCTLLAVPAIPQEANPLIFAHLDSASNLNVLAFDPGQAPDDLLAGDALAALGFT